MKRIFLLIVVCLLVIVLSCISASAAQTDMFDHGIEQIEYSIDPDTAGALTELGAGGVDDIVAEGVSYEKLWLYLLTLITSYSHEPFAALFILAAVFIFISVAESYTYSLRYVETKDIMGVAVSLFVASVFIRPVTELASAAVGVITGASSVMTVYLPVAAGMMVFSGHAAASGGYYAAVTGAAALLSRFASTVLTPLLNIFLSLSVSAGVCTRIHLGGIIEAVSKWFKYGITFAMSIFIAVIGLNSALSGAADSVAGKAVRFTMSSFIPLIGSSVAEAYGAIQNSANILRSGIGVFVILAIFVAFAPLMVRTLLWSAALGIAKTVGEVLSVSSAGAVVDALSRFLSALRALLIAVSAVFIISSAAMIAIGGGS